jgi:hypothetical protein
LVTLIFIFSVAGDPYVIVPRQWKNNVKLPLC